MNIIKRDGTVQEYSITKVKNAVTKAFKSVNQEPPEGFIEQIDQQIMKQLDKDKEVTVEDIQDIIQNALIKKNQYDVVKSFILYRNKREEVRQSKSKLIKDVNKALNASDIQNQNANIDEASFGGRVGEAARVVCKDQALKHMSKLSRKNHEDGWIYIHDLDSYLIGQHNCLSIPFDHLLKNGFTTRQTDVRGANSVNTAFQLVAVLFQLQSLQQFGGVSATHLDWTMQPYVRKSHLKHYNEIRETADILTFGLFNIKPVEMNDDTVINTEIDNNIFTGKHWYNIFHKTVSKVAILRTRKEIHQAVEGLYHNLNTLQLTMAA